MDQYSREFIAEKARLRPEDLGLVRTARRSHNQLGLAYQIAFIRLTGRAPGQQPFGPVHSPFFTGGCRANPRCSGGLVGKLAPPGPHCVTFGKMNLRILTSCEMRNVS